MIHLVHDLFDGVTESILIVDTFLDHVAWRMVSVKTSKRSILVFSFYSEINGRMCRIQYLDDQSIKTYDNEKIKVYRETDPKDKREYLSIFLGSKVKTDEDSFLFWWNLKRMNLIEKVRWKNGSMSMVSRFIKAWYCGDSRSVGKGSHWIPFRWPTTTSFLWRFGIFIGKRFVWTWSESIHQLLFAALVHAERNVSKRRAPSPVVATRQWTSDDLIHAISRGSRADAEEAAAFLAQSRARVSLSLKAEENQENKPSHANCLE